MTSRRLQWLNAPYGVYLNRDTHVPSIALYLESELWVNDNEYFNEGNGRETWCRDIVSPANTNKNKPNYLVVYNGEEVESRWYVLDVIEKENQEPTEESIYDYILKRDIFMDELPNILLGRFYAERGQTDDNDVRIFNSETGVAFNEIKKYEIDLVEEGSLNNNKWGIIYYDRSVLTAAQSEGIPGLSVSGDTVVLTLDLASVSDYTQTDVTNNPFWGLVGGSVSTNGLFMSNRIIFSHAFIMV